MAVKISQLTASNAITSDDFFPIVDSGSMTTLRASAAQILNYVTGSTFNTLTASVALFNGNIRVLGTASINQLNTVGQTSLLVGDKYITILSGGVDHTGISGSGFLWGTSSGPGETTGALGEHAHILYDSSRDALEIFPGLYVTGSTTLFEISGTTAQFTSVTGALSGTASRTTNSVTFSTSGGAAVGSTFNGSAALTVSPATIGAAGLTSANTFTSNNTFSGGTNSFNGSVALPIQSLAITSTLTANTSGMYFITAPTGTTTISLPSPFSGGIIYLIRTDATANLINIFGNINGVVTTNSTWFPISTANRRAVLVSNGSTWYPIIAGTVA